MNDDQQRPHRSSHPMSEGLEAAIKMLGPAIEEAMKPKPWYKTLQFKIVMYAIGLLLVGGAIGSLITWIVMS